MKPTNSLRDMTSVPRGEAAKLKTAADTISLFGSYKLFLSIDAPITAALTSINEALMRRYPHRMNMPTPIFCDVRIDRPRPTNNGSVRRYRNTTATVFDDCRHQKPPPPDDIAGDIPARAKPRCLRSRHQAGRGPFAAQFGATQSDAVADEIEMRFYRKV